MQENLENVEASGVPTLSPIFNLTDLEQLYVNTTIFPVILENTASSSRAGRCPQFQRLW